MARHTRAQTPPQPARTAQPGLFPWDSLNCSILLTDIAGFGDPRRDDVDRRTVRDTLYGMLREAFRESKLPWARCYREDRGDGVLVVFPPSVSTFSVADPFLAVLAAKLRRHNQEAAEAVRIQLRAALHVGPVFADPEGVSGESLIHAARLLAAPVLKEALASAGADLAVMVSGHVYDTVIRHGPGRVDPSAYQRVEFRVKESDIIAWMHISPSSVQLNRWQPTTAAQRPVPAQLPADVPEFTGRSAELATLDQLQAIAFAPAPAHRVGKRSAAVVISAVSGTAGVGKTALAVRWAHRVRAMFPDGQLYVNLRGYDPEQPVQAADALAGFLRALGAAAADIPAEMDERAALYRSLLDGRRMLVVLDNAAAAEQIRSLLPGTPTCAVVVTSRDSLAGLVARDGARRVDLGLLPPRDSVALLRALIGERVEADSDAADALASQCAHLPLALRVAAELAVARPVAPLAQLVTELADERGRLDLLDASGDPHTAVRSVFSWSYRHLPSAEARTAFRLLGLPPGPELDVYAAAALTGAAPQQVQHLLDLLTRAHLLQPAGPLRYGMHDLLRAYAADLAAAEDSEDDSHAALTRLFDYYLAAAATAMDTLVPAEQHRRPQVQSPAAPARPFADPVAARAWLDAERTTLVAVAVYSAARRWPTHAIRLATTLFRYLEAGGHYSDAVIIHSCARSAACRTGNRAAEAYALTSLGLVNWRQGYYEQAADHHRQALAVSHQIGDRPGEARALGHLGLVYERQSRYQEAADHHQRALDLCRQLGDKSGEARVLGNLGTVYQRQGDYQQAAARLYQALDLFRQIGDRDGEAEARNCIGEALLPAGQHDLASAQHTAALTLASQTGNQYEQARAHYGLGRVCHVAGDLRQVRRHWHRALDLYTELDVPDASHVRAQLAMLDQAKVSAPEEGWNGSADE